MTTILAALTGYLIGSIPSAGFLGRLRGIDLRSEGSGNPGTANALRTSGITLAFVILVVEAAKGLAAVWAGHGLGDEVGAIAAGLGAVAGNVYNIWYRFHGGKGLGISLGVLAGLWPGVVLPIVAVMIVSVLISRSAGIASLVTILALLVSAILWTSNQWATGGVEPTVRLVVLSAGIGALIFWKHWRDSPLSSPGPR